MADARFVWHGPQCVKAVEAEYGKRVRAACIWFSRAVKSDISQAGTLRYRPKLKKGGLSKTRKTVYNFTHSVPGNPPYKQTGLLRSSITWEVTRFRGRVGTNLKYGRYLELGTSRMKARPFLRSALLKYRGQLRQILERSAKASDLVTPVDQSRSGVMGKGTHRKPGTSGGGGGRKGGGGGSGGGSGKSATAKARTAKGENKSKRKSYEMNVEGKRVKVSYRRRTHYKNDNGKMVKVTRYTKQYHLDQGPGKRMKKIKAPRRYTRFDSNGDKSYQFGFS